MGRDGDSDEADDRYVCEVCGESFESGAALEDHLFSVGLVY